VTRRRSRGPLPAWVTRGGANWPVPPLRFHCWIDAERDGGTAMVSGSLAGLGVHVAPLAAGTEWHEITGELRACLARAGAVGLRGQVPGHGHPVRRARFGHAGPVHQQLGPPGARLHWQVSRGQAGGEGAGNSSPLNHRDSRTVSNRFDQLVTVRDPLRTVQCFSLISRHGSVLSRRPAGRRRSNRLPARQGRCAGVRLGR
jgi:hypothetical protein